MRSKLFCAILLVVGILASVTSGQRKSMPPMPFVDKGACPFECCTYREWNVTKTTIARKNMNDASSIAFRMKTGEKVLGITGVVITSKPGEVLVLKRTKLGRFDLKKGDKIFLLTNLGEGFHKIWFRGKIFEDAAYDETKFKVIHQPTAIWWVKVKNRRGQIGWSRLPENFGNMDECG